MKQNRILFFVLILVILISFTRYFLLIKDIPKTTTFVDVSASVTPSPSSSLSENSATPVPNIPLESLNPHEKEQLQVLSEIFKSKNDNDPRMDQMLKNLSPELKLALQKQYSEMKAELRNERGTIAFLIGRELKEGRGSPADIQFLKSVLMEKPCMSLSDCSKPNVNQSPEEQHLEGIHETTAHYPQLIDLRYLKQALENGNLSAENRTGIIAALEAAHQSPNPRVVQEAQAILDSLPH